MSNTLVLVRFAYAPFGTYGNLFLGGTRLYTVEQPWRLNERQRSCVPEGDYQLIKHNSSKYPNTFALINPALNVYYQPGPGVPESGRKAILIHPGNVPEDLMGCISPGMSVGYLRDRWAVLNSRGAMDLLRSYIAANNVKRLIITNLDPSMSVDDMGQYAARISQQA
jgi:hypothetical protein